MYGTTKARRTLYVALALGLLALALGLRECWGTPLARYMPFVGALAPQATSLPRVPTPTPTPARPGREQVIALVQAYNQADVLANRTNDLAQLLPYVHPDGPLYTALAAEYRRRIAAGEVHNVQLTRFWATEPVVTAGEITLETQEVWDEAVLDGRTGEVRSAQVGIVTRQRYTIRPDAGGAWRIWDLELVASGGYTP
jgi:hypothetical protein